MINQVICEDKIRDQLTHVMAFLSKQSAFNGDSLSWAADSLKSYLDGNAKTLDHAFGLCSGKTGPKPMKSGTHDDWVAAAWVEVSSSTPIGKEYPDTKKMAEIGRYFGLGGKDPANADDHGIASHLKRILKSYHEIYVQQLSDELLNRWKEKK